MKRSLVCASLVGFFATPAWAAADPSSTTDATGSSGVVSDDDAPDASAGARGGRGGGGGGSKGGGGGGGSKGGGGGGSHAGGGKGSHAGGSHASGKGGSHAHAPRASDKPAASQHGSRSSVSNHPSRAPSRSIGPAHAPTRTPAHAPSRTVANKTVHPGSPPRATHNPAAARAVYNAKPAHHNAVIFPRWRPSYHRYHLGHGVPAHWTHGVFVYSPPPARRVVVVDGQRRVVESGTSDDLRAVDRNGDLGIGFVAGSFMSTYRGGVGSYGDFGMGLNLTWRPVEAVGLEGAWTHHSDTWDDEQYSERDSDIFSGSMKLYAMPWTRVSPYLSLGVTGTQRQFEDTYYDGFTTQTETVDDTLIGPHVGLGLELAIGRSAALDFEGRMIGYMNKLPEDPAAPFAGQFTGGLKLYF